MSDRLRFPSNARNDNVTCGSGDQKTFITTSVPEMISEPPTGWSAPNSQAQSLNSSGTSSSGTIPVQRPTKITRNQGPVPAAAAITAMSNIAEQLKIVSSSSSSDIDSVVSTSTREARLASALAKKATAQNKYELENANQEVAEHRKKLWFNHHQALSPDLATC